MSKNQQQRNAIEAVAKRFPAKWEQAGTRGGGYLIVGGKRISVTVATLDAVRRDDGAKIRLRFDKVATRVIQRLHAALRERVPDGTTVLLTITAPIREPSKTAAALEDRLQGLLKPKAARRDESDMIQGNRVQIRFLKCKSARAPKLLGFVHNPDSDTVALLNRAGKLVELLVNAAARRVSTERWVVVTSADGLGYLDAYRSICSQLGTATGFEKILIVFDGGRVETI